MVSRESCFLSECEKGDYSGRRRFRILVVKGEEALNEGGSKRGWKVSRNRGTFKKEALVRVFKLVKWG